MKIKNINFNNLKYSIAFEKNGNKLFNVKYSSEILQFQTPKVLIKEIDKEYLTLELKNTGACKSFYEFVINLETTYPNIKSIFDGNLFKVKVQHFINIYSNGRLFNFYDLKQGMEIICLLEYSKLWVNNYLIANYIFNVKEISVTLNDKL